jgi:hypothetical protein
MSLAVLEELLPVFYQNARSLMKMDSFVKMKNGTLTTYKKPGTFIYGDINLM